MPEGKTRATRGNSIQGFQGFQPGHRTSESGHNAAQIGQFQISLQKPLKLARFSQKMAIFSASLFWPDGTTSFLLSNLGANQLQQH